ncbi:MAG: SagB/ThcOx family dehydrogenase [Parabacteroides sp.]|nr:SagB/ThcOx family dehydrogenase [Parabacteroides sp.]
MKKLLFIVCSLFLIMSMNAQKQIKLNAPNKSRGTTVMKALSERHSVRDFSSKELSLQDLSDLLWAANGINRSDGKRTAPSAMNKQDVDIYVIMKSGAYLYDAKNQALKPVVSKDLRGDVAGGQDFVKAAPVSLVLVSDISRFGSMASKEMNTIMGAVDVGTVCQNINLFCAATGLITVPRASMEKEALKQSLKLTDNQILIMNNPVGYPQK